MAGVGAQMDPRPERAGGDVETWPSERLPDSYLPKLQKSSCPPKWGLRIGEVLWDGGSGGGQAGWN